MKKLTFVLATLISIIVYSIHSLADSPITSTSFYEAYLDVEIVKEAKEAKVLNNRIFLYLSEDSNPIDVKAATINALGWDFNGKNNAEIYSKLKFKKSLGDLNSDELSGNDLFCIGYLQALDDYFYPERALPFLQKSKDKMQHSQTVSIIYSIVKGQAAMDNPRKWGNVWKPFEEVMNDKTLQSEFKPAAIKIINDYMILYKEYTTTDEQTNHGESNNLNSMDDLNQTKVKVTYEPLSKESTDDEVLNSVKNIFAQKLDIKNILQHSVNIVNSNKSITIEIPWKESCESYAAYTYFENLIKTPSIIFQEIEIGKNLDFKRKGGVILNNNDIANAYPYMTDSSSWAVYITLTSEGLNKFSEASGKLVGKHIGIFLDNNLISAPIVNERISGESLIIRLGDTKDTLNPAKELAKIINSKALPIELKPTKIEFKNFKFKDKDISSYKSRIELQSGNPIMIVNGEKRKIDSQNNTCPLIINGRTLLPIRSLIESLGGTILWNSDDKKISITLNNKVIDLFIGKNTAIVNNKSVELDAVPQIISDRTMLPLRFIAENLDCSIDWNNTSGVITIYYIK